VDTAGPSLEAVREPTPLLGDLVLLEPLQVAHAAQLGDVLDDPGLHTFIGGTPATEAQLVERFGRQVVGWSPDRSERWLNWVVRRQADDQVVGTVQSTVTSVDGRLVAELAWVIGTAYQGQGYARDSAETMVGWLRLQGVSGLVAHIHPDHHASQAVARGLGLGRTGTWHDGEERWESWRRSRGRCADHQPADRTHEDEPGEGRDEPSLCLGLPADPAENEGYPQPHRQEEHGHGGDHEGQSRGKR
jgi:RimJ/RimL family protein N-acetyltransferase